VVGFHTDAVTFFFQGEKKEMPTLKMEGPTCDLAHGGREGGREGGEGGGSEPAGGVGIGVFDYGV
jgi:hypothetical protein